MANELNYCAIRSGGWNLKVQAEKWNRDLWQHVKNTIWSQLPSQHPQTVTLRFPDKNGDARFFLKIYHAPSGMAKFKDVLRESKAFPDT